MKNRFKLVLLGSMVALMVTTVSAQTSGADIYKAKCQMCHGADGSGNTPAGKAMKAHPFDSPDVIKMSDSELIAVVKDGKERMPAFGEKLTDAQIKNVVAYIRTLQKK
ncbi:MAG: cytochrome c [Acidobacteriaceae bacterium]